MIQLIKEENGYSLYDLEKGKSISFIYAGNLDYYVVGRVYSNGSVETDKTLVFDIDKSNIEIYNVVGSLFDNVKRLNLELRSGKKRIAYPPHSRGILSSNQYDKSKIYDPSLNAVIWPSEASSNPIDRNSIMTIEEKEDVYRFRFINETLIKFNERYDRSVCICNSGSRSDMFPSLFWAFYNDLKKLPETKEKENIKILKK